MVRELRGRTDHLPRIERTETKEEMVARVSTEMAGSIPVGNITLLPEVVERLHGIEGEVAVATAVESIILVLLTEKIVKGAAEEASEVTEPEAIETLTGPPPIVIERAAQAGRRTVTVPIEAAIHLELHHPEM